MVKHMIIWKFKEEIQAPQETAALIKEALEGLVGRIDGLLEMHIHINPLPSSSGDLMMDSLFASKEALEEYQKNPLHTHIANTLVRPAVSLRLSLDFEV